MADNTVANLSGDAIDWMHRASGAIHESLVMAESIAKIANVIADKCSGPDAFALAEAIVACTRRIEAAVVPMANEGIPEVPHVA